MQLFLTHLVLATPLVAAYALFALGIVLIYRASRVLNLAHGVMAMLPAYVVREVTSHRVPLPIALVVGIASGAALGAAVELVFVRRLRHVSPTAQTVGTVAVYGLVVAIVAKVFGTSPVPGTSVFGDKVILFGSSGISHGQIGLIVVSLVLTGALFLLFKVTPLGLAMRGAASNRTAASLVGVNPDRTTQAAWMMGGALAAIAGILLGAVITLDPYGFPLQALPAFVAALIGGLGSMPGALLGSLVVGLTVGIVPGLKALPGIEHFAGSVGASQAVLALVAFVVMATRGERLAISDVRAGGLSASRKQGGDPTATRQSSALLRRLGPWPAAIAVVALLGWVWIAPFSTLGTGNLALTYALEAISLVVLTGWVGQISLAQASFVGVGAYVTGMVIRSWGIQFPLTLVVAAVAAGGVAALLGLVAVRVRGLYLAVATLIFAWMSQAYLFNQPWLAGVGGSSSAPVKPLGEKGQLPYLDFADRRTFYYVLLAVTASALIGLATLRDSKTGRAWFAVKGSEVAAASLGIPVTRYKLIAFATSGVIAGAAGSMVFTHQQVVSATAFAPSVSLLFLAIAVVGGLTSLPGAVAAGVLFALLEELFFRVDALAGLLDIVSAMLLVIVLLFFPAGLAGIPRSLRSAARRFSTTVRGVAGRSVANADEAAALVGDDAPAAVEVEPVEQVEPVAPKPPAPVSDATSAPSRWRQTRLAAALLRLSPRQAEERDRTVRDALAEARVRASAARDAADAASAAAVVYTPGTATRPDLPPRPERNLVLRAQDITVKFGGLTAVDNMNLEVREGEIVGLIGPNGAGKTTCFNAISGLNSPTAGTVELFGTDITRLPVHERASRGMGRTFQLIQLFPELTVFDNLMVATHTRTPTGYFSHLVASAPALEAEAESRQRVSEVVELLGLNDVAQRPVAGLPFGILRMVEMARTLVTGAPFVMLDEPASGLDNAETDRLADLLFWVRQSLGVTLLLIEHDVRMVASVTDYLYVIDRGKQIAHGEPADVQRDPAVIAAYLGDASVTEPSTEDSDAALAGATAGD